MKFWNLGIRDCLPHFLLGVDVFYAMTPPLEDFAVNDFETMVQKNTE